MWTMSNRPAPPLNTNFNTINNSPFTKMKKINQNINKINVICEGNPIKQIKTLHDNQINNSPFQFDVNLYFGNPKSSFTPRHPMDNFYSHHNDVHQNMPICLLFKASLEKSGYKLTPEQTVQYKDVYKKYNSINSFYDDFNYYYLPIREIPINSNNNIINNIYPTFTKVTNVQILSDNENNKSNLSTDKNKYNINKNIVNLENKKENIQNINNICKKDSDSSTKEEKKSINNNISIIINGNNNDNVNKKQKVLFECSESNTPNTTMISKNFMKKKRLRKNNEQLGLLSRFYLKKKLVSVPTPSWKFPEVLTSCKVRSADHYFHPHPSRPNPQSPIPILYLLLFFIDF